MKILGLHKFEKAEIEIAYFYTNPAWRAPMKWTNIDLVNSCEADDLPSHL